MFVISTIKPDPRQPLISGGKASGSCIGNPKPITNRTNR